MPRLSGAMTPIKLEWKGGESFQAITSNETGSGEAAVELELGLDGSRENGFSPMDALLAAVGGCMGIDVVLILTKMRATVDSLRITVDGERNEDPPRYFRNITMRFELQGAITRAQAERAVSLSRETYCSVLHTLRKDLDFETELRIVEAREDSKPPVR